MRKLWAALATVTATLCLATPAHADQPAYNQLRAWYALGAPMKLHDLDGFYSGRCFAAATPNHAEGVMLGSYTRSVGENRGPAFPSKHPETKIVSVQKDYAPADYFDDEGLFAQNKAALESNMKANWARTGSVHEDPTLWYAIDWEGNGRYDEGHSLVVYGDYFVERWTALVDQTYGGGWGYHKRGDILSMCYYFKKMN